MGYWVGVKNMREVDCFRVAVNNMIEGTMFHNQMIQYFEYLGLSGFSKLQCIRFRDENSEMVCLQRYVIRTYGVVVGESNPDSRSYIPQEWGEKLRETIVDGSEYVKFGVETWKDWEERSKKKYNSVYFDLCDLRDAGGSERILKVVKETEKELHFVYDIMCKLRNCNYDSVSVNIMNDNIVDMYKMFNKKGDK